MSHLSFLTILQVAELLSRGWSEEEMKDVMGGNLMRVMDEVDSTRESLRESLPSSAIWEKRQDLPARHWGGPGDAYFPYEVRNAVAQMIVQHDEL